MDNPITNITIASDDSNRLILILITKEMFATSVLNSLANPLKIKSSVTDTEVNILVPIYGGNGAVEFIRALCENENWANINDAHLWTVGYYQDERVTLVMPLRVLQRIDEQ